MHVHVHISDLPLNVGKYGVYAWDKSAHVKDVAVVKKFCPMHVNKTPYLFKFEIHIIISLFHPLIFKSHFTINFIFFY